MSLEHLAVSESKEMLNTHTHTHIHTQNTVFGGISKEHKSQLKEPQMTKPRTIGEKFKTLILDSIPKYKLNIYGSTLI